MNRRQVLKTVLTAADGACFLAPAVSSHRMPPRYQWLENCFAQDRVSGYTFQARGQFRSVMTTPCRFFAQ
jgi:hypothetical protein